MSHKTKYLGSNCKPVIAETVESNKTQTQFSPKENIMTAKIDSNESVFDCEKTTPVTTMKIEIDPANVAVPTEQLIEKVDAAVTEVMGKPSILKQVAAAKAAKSKFNWLNVAAAGALAGIAVTARMIVENKLSDEEDIQHSVLGIAGRAVASATVAASIQSGVQLAINNTNDVDGLGLVTLSAVGNGVSVIDALYGDSIQSMFGGAISKSKSAIDSYLTKEEAEEIQA